MTRTIIVGLLLIAGCTDVENLGARSHPVFGSPPRWAITLGNVDADAAGTVAFDHSGDVIAGGGFKGAVDFGRNTLVSTHPASWVSKRSGLDGTELWTVGIGMTSGEQAAVVDLGTTADGSVLALGSFGGDLNLGNVILHAGTITTGSDCFVAKYDPAGQLQWARQLGAASLASCSDLAVADDGRFAIVGAYVGTLELPGKTTTARDHDPFMIAFDAAGQPVFGVTTQNPGGVPGMYAASVAISGENDIVIAGGIGFPMVFERVVLQPNARTSQYVARFTLDGQMLWAGVLGERDVQQATGPISVDGDGGVIVTSQRREDSDGDNGTPGIVRLDPNGRTTWDREAVSGSAMVHSMTVLDNGTIITGGYTSGFSVDLGTGALDGCMYLAAHDAEGRVLDAIAYLDRGNGCSSVVPRSLAAGPSGAFAFSGFLDKAVDFGTGPLRFAGTSDAMIVVQDTQ